MNQMVLKGLLVKVDSEVLTHEEQVQLRSAIIAQVDQAAAFERELAQRIAEEKARADAIYKSAADLEQQRQMFLGYIRDAMQADGFEKLPGERYEVLLKTNPPKLVIDHDPSEYDAEAFPSLVRVKYEWNANHIKALLADGARFQGARLISKTEIKFKERKVK